ncbi:U-box domain-containing protein 34-like isoform X2 [Durio zibethinus]|uniref:RING-type E3 ubiquitin transferase n=1 Tax=Durio zibethinus TaxID=66656 RepID=A0A6P5ZR29_DURZI|nr:U-box domain-containing protein 34-like isoform X2 [Durio zibethinus]
MTTVAVAVKGGTAGGSGSRRAVRWAVENLKADRVVLVHVMPTVTSVPTPSGDRIPITDMDENVVAMYVQEVKLKFEDVFIPFKKLFKTRKMETLVLEDDNPATGLLRYISEFGINTLVLGSYDCNCITRKLKGSGVPNTVLRCAPDTCDIQVVYRQRIITKSANILWTSGTSNRSSVVTATDQKESSSGISKHISSPANASAESTLHNFIGIESLSEHSFPYLRASSSVGSSTNASTIKQSDSMASTKVEQLNLPTEVEQLRLELQNTIAMYKQACEELVYTQNKVQLVSSECLEEARRVNAALEREETFRKIAAEEKAKHLQAIKQVDEAKNLLSKEAYERQVAELNAEKESLEKQKIVDALFCSDRRYRKYTRDEIEVATDFFSESNVIGHGGYGKVYKCSLHRTPVAVKIFQPDAVDRKEEFLKEVEVLSQLHHPHIVLLLGACPENGCLVYEYMENGSLEEHIFQRNGKPPLPWFIRFRIVFEVASGLAFLHSSKPDPIVHRDLKPGNILLDGNYVSKIGDVGLAKLISDIVPDNITEYKDSILAGTLCYMDPEYQRTGTIRPKSDLYALGITTLQLLTARHPNGLILAVENAITKSSFADILDKSVTDWPLAETEELARIALKCSKLRCRDRPDLDTVVLPILKRLVEVADDSLNLEKNNVYARSHYFCPILQEVMDDPHIAADGFTYEHRAIKAWLEKHNVSPVTKRRLQHSILTPNHTLRSAIQDWKSRVTLSSKLY